MAYKLTFITIGYIERRKGQDVLLEAITGLPKDIMDEAEFVIVGQNTSLLAKDLANKASTLDNVKMIGVVPREEVHKLLTDANVMLCPSREDPMPTVCAEAMMHSVPCIVSDATGTSAYIKDGYDGLTFESENKSELREKIVWCVQHRSELIEMGKRAYGIYEKYFSPRVFEENLLAHVNEMLNNTSGID